METIRCPYCECKVLVSDVDAEDGTCPECGAPLMGSLLFDPQDAARGDEYEEEEEEEDVDLNFHRRRRKSRND